MLRGYTQWLRQCLRVTAGMHALHGLSAVSMNTVPILVMGAQESSSAIVTRQVILMLSEPLSIDPPVCQLTAFEII
jgi:hypothetical protein